MNGDRIAVVVVAAALGAVAPAWADRDGGRAATVSSDVGGDRFVSGATTRVATPVAGDLVAAGGSVDIDAPVGGDVVVFGGNVRVSAPVGQSVYGAGGQLVLRGEIGRNLRLAGGQVELAPGAVARGNVSVAGGQVTLDGAVDGFVQAAGGSVRLNAPVGGDVFVSAGSLALGPNARIEGRLRYVGRDAIERHPDAQVRGGVEVVTGIADAHESRRGVAAGLRWAWTAGLLALTVLLVAALPRLATRAADTLVQRPWASIGWGFVALVCIPAAAIVAMVTVIGIPLGLLALALYPVLLLLGYLTTGIGVGLGALRRLRPDAPASTTWRIGAAAAAVLVIALLGRLPWLGGLVAFVALIAGVGVLMLMGRRAGPAP